MEDPVVGRVRQIIDETGQQQRTIAERIGIDPTKLSKSLSGNRRFTSLELALLAQLGNRTVDWLLTGASSRSWTFAHRLNASTTSDANKAGEQVIKELAQHHEGLEALGFLPPVKFVDDAPTLPGSFVAAGNALADWAVSKFPVALRDLSNADLIAHVEQVFNLDVVVADLPDGCDGMSYEDGSLRVILLGTTDRAARQRYTLAHELGHILGHDADQQVIREKLGKSSSIRERRANVFAASFLAPVKEIAAAYTDPQVTHQQLAWEFAVSPESFSWRLYNLSRLNETSRQELAGRTSADIASELGRTPEQFARDQAAGVPRPPLRLASSYLRAFYAGQATLNPLASILGMDRDEAYARFASKPDSVVGNPEQLEVA